MAAPVKSTAVPTLNLPLYPLDNKTPNVLVILVQSVSQGEGEDNVVLAPALYARIDALPDELKAQVKVWLESQKRQLPGAKPLIILPGN